MNTSLCQERYTVQRINDDTSKNVKIITDPLLLIHVVTMTAIAGFGATFQCGPFSGPSVA